MKANAMKNQTGPVGLMKSCSLGALHGLLIIAVCVMAMCNCIHGQVASIPIKDPVSIKVSHPATLFSVGSEIALTGTIRVAEGHLPVFVGVTTAAFVAVDENSDASNIEIVSPCDLIHVSQIGVRPFDITFFVKGDGEYELTVSLQSNDTVVESVVLSVLARNGKVAVSSVGLRNCEWQLLMDKHFLPITTKTSEIDEETRSVITSEFQKIMRERNKDIKDWKKQNSSQTPNNPGGISSISKTKNGKLVFRAFWTARDDSGKERQLSIVGAKVDVFEDDQTTRITGGTLDLEGPYADNLEAGGVFEFDDPGKDFYVRVIPEFDGDPVFQFLWWTWTDFDPFEVVDVDGQSYGYWADKNSLSYEASYAQGNMNDDREGGVWAAYHGTHSVVLGAKMHHSIEKGSSFECVFPNDNNPNRSSGTYFSPRTRNVYIEWRYRYGWDTIAHELSHLIDDANNLITGGWGAEHDGGNQYNYRTAAANPHFHDKEGAILLGLGEAFASWFGAHLTHRSPYEGLVSGVGDSAMSGFWDLEESAPYNAVFSGTDTWTGEDTEIGVQRFMWDVADSAPEFPDERVTVAGVELHDYVGDGFGETLDFMKGKLLGGIHDFWRQRFLPGWSSGIFGESAVTSWGFDVEAEQVAELLVAHGMSPVLTSPASGARIDLDDLTTPIRFEWQANQHSGHADLTMDEFILVLYSFDYATVLFDTGWITSTDHTLSDQERQDIRTNMGQDLTDIKAVVFGRNDHQDVLTGPYASNVVNLNVTGYNRYVVMVVDSSGSNSQTDPTDQRKVAARTTINRLVSSAEAQAQGLTPDLVAAIDFDSSVTILSGFDDPPIVEPTINRVDSSGGTEIDDGIRAAINLIENVQVGGRTALTSGKSMICVFTDGENNDGPDPVISAIADAKSKSIRVHYGFLNPLAKGKGMVDETRVKAETKSRVKSAYSSIEEAVLDTGGVYGEIADDISQLAFVDQMFRTGLTGVDPADEGSIVGQVDIAGRIQESLKEANFYFAGQKDEGVIITVRGIDFVPEVHILDREGNFIGFDKNYDGDNIAQVTLMLPYTGMFNVKVSTKTSVGRFRIFVDVENPGTGIVEDVTEFTSVSFENWRLDYSTGALLAAMTLGSNPGSPKTLKDAFWYVVPKSSEVMLVSVDGTTPDGLPYVDITALVNSALPNIGNGDLNLDPGEEVQIDGIEIYSQDRSVPEGYVYALWADPPVSETKVHPHDTNADNRIDDFEILEVIDAWEGGQMDDMELLKAIDLWRAGGYYWDAGLEAFTRNP